jgi:hypothetical protein
MRMLLTTMCALFAVLLCAPAQPAEQTGAKAVLVTGASSGIGRKITEHLAANGRAEEKAHMLEAWGPMMDPATFPEADEVAVAVAQALSEPNPKRRYLAIPRNAKDRINSRLAERLIRWQMKQLVQWNEGHAYTLDRATLIKMLDEALVDARPRTP